MPTHLFIYSSASYVYLCVCMSLCKSACIHVIAKLWGEGLGLGLTHEHTKCLPCSEGPQLAWEMVQQESYKAQQREMPSPAPGEEWLWASGHTRGQPAGKQLCRGSPGGTLVHQVGQEPAMCPHSKNQQCPGLNQGLHCQQVRGSDPSSLFSSEYLECLVQS